MNFNCRKPEGPDGNRSEVLQTRDLKVLTNELNEIITNNDDKLTSNYLVPVGKPSEDQTQACT